MRLLRARRNKEQGQEIEKSDGAMSGMPSVGAVTDGGSGAEKINMEVQGRNGAKSGNQSAGVTADRRSKAEKINGEAPKSIGAKSGKQRAVRWIRFWRQHQGTVFTVAVTAAILVFAGGCMWMNLRLAELGTRMSYLQDTVSVVQTDLGSLQADLGKTLRKEYGILEECRIEVSEVDFQKDVYRVEIDVVPKEYTDNTALSIYFGTREYLLKKEGFHYTGELELPIAESYDGNVTVLITNGKKKNTEILPDYEGYPTLLEASLNGRLTEQPVCVGGTLTLAGTVDYRLLGQEIPGMKQFESLCLIVEIGGEKHIRQQLITEEAIEENPAEYVGPIRTEKVSQVQLFEISKKEGPEASQPELRQGESEMVQPGSRKDGSDSAGAGSILEGSGDAGSDESLKESTEASDSSFFDFFMDGGKKQQKEAQGKAEEPEVELAAGIVKGLSGTIALSLREQLKKRTSVRIYLQALSTENYVCERELYSGVFVPGLEGTFVMEEGNEGNSLKLRDPKGWWKTFANVSN